MAAGYGLVISNPFFMSISELLILATNSVLPDEYVAQLERSFKKAKPIDPLIPTTGVVDAPSNSDLGPSATTIDGIRTQRTESGPNGRNPDSTDGIRTKRTESGLNGRNPDSTDEIRTQRTESGLSGLNVHGRESWITSAKQILLLCQ
ncbi:hypothetical protein BV898_04381 [Hypsibius exemplaris]|uniref:Uncharacterized protein n=1 Tax=Hypsibius exemplaris TaxID=2072580 RepID=A0A1W0X2S2_HYPEX|nr:hypothetical protein BV898_04381 [Hypsibius exemplaris]